jgi:hypothetical protein
MFKRLLGTATTTTLVAPVTTGAATVDGVVIDRLTFHDAIAHFSVGVASGAPTAQSHKITIYHGDASDGSDLVAFALPRYMDATGNYEATLTADGTGKSIDINLAGAKRYISAKIVTSFTGGTSPKQTVSATLVKGNAEKEPVL